MLARTVATQRGRGDDAAGLSQSPAVPGSEETPTPERSLLLVGNPNVGKSVLFGHLTGRYANVSNYPGTTVEITRGKEREGADAVLDTPGTNSLLAVSEDERVTRALLLDEVLAGTARAFQVCDAKNLRRGLLLALQLAELEVPTVFVANLLDEATARGLAVDLSRLSNELGVDVVGTVATRGEGVEALRAAQPRVATAAVRYDDDIEAAVADASDLLADGTPGLRALALLLLAEGADGEAAAQLTRAGLLPMAGSPQARHTAQRLEGIRAPLLADDQAPLRARIERARLAAADVLVSKVVTRSQAAKRGWADRLGDWAMHPVWGLLIAALALYLTYLFVGELGAGHAVDFLESDVFGAYLVPWCDRVLRALLPAGAESFLLGSTGLELGTGPGLLIGDYGLISMALSYAVAIVLPIVGFFFLAFSLMEDSGYLPRLAVMLDRTFRVMGLNGKAVLPMILGLGCDTMATMTARILPTRKERVMVTLLLALGVPCSAQLGVILGMIAALSLWATAVWAGVVIAIIFAVGALANKVLPGQRGDFILEIPPLRRPSIKNALVKTAVRIEWYLKEAVPLFVLGTLVLWLLDRMDVLSSLQVVAAPVVQGLLGLPAQAADAFLIGFLRRDYGAAGLYMIFRPYLDAPVVATVVQIQMVTAMVTITLFVPCIANVFIIVKERGWKTALKMSLFIVPFAFLAGGLVNHVLRAVMV